jgi:1-deoxy-D-xylulose-5-phosphate synthase
MGPGTGLTKFQETFPERYFDVGIAEGHGVTFAAGLATQGVRPVCAIYSTFLQRAFDHVFHDVALQHLPVIFALDRAGLVGADGPTHHGCFDLTYLRVIPEMIVAAPKDADELADLLETAYAHTEGPFAIRYPRDNSETPRTRAPRVLPIGEWEILSPGDWDTTLLAVGSMIPLARAVAARLEERGLAPTLVNARFVKPLDLTMLRAAAQNARLVATFEENSLLGGFGAAIHEASVEHGLGLSGRLTHFGLPDRFVDHGSRAELLADVGLTPERIAEQILVRLGVSGDGAKASAQR